MRHFGKSALAVVAMSVSLLTGLAGGSTVKAHDAGAVPVAPSVVYGAEVNNAPCVISQYDQLNGSQTLPCTSLTFWWATSTAPNPAGTTYTAHLLAPAYNDDFPFVCGETPPPDSSSPVNQTSLQIEGSNTVCSVVIAAQGISFDGSGGFVWNFRISASMNGQSSTSPSGQWVNGSELPLEKSISITAGSSTIAVSWGNPSASNAFSLTGVYDVRLLSQSGATLLCSTSSTSCTFRGLDPATSYMATVAPETTVGISFPWGTSYSIYPVTATKLSVKALPVAFNGSTTALVYGVASNTSVTVGIPGTVTSCTTNAVGQCTVGLSEAKTGSYNILAVAGSQHATASVWYPAISVPRGVNHGKSVVVSIHNAPPKAAVSIATSDKRTIKATTNSAGGASVSVSTKTPEFLTLTVTIGGTAFPPYQVQVS